MNRTQGNDFRLKRIYADGSQEPAELYDITDLEGGWTMGRRGFLATAAVTLGAAAGMTAGLPPTASGAETGSSLSLGCDRDIRAHEDDVEHLAFSRDGRLLASGGGREPVKVWEVPGGGRVDGWVGKRGVAALAWHPTQDLLALAMEETVSLYPPASDKPVRQLKDHPGEVAHIAIGEDGILLVADTSKGTVVVWNLGAGTRLNALEVPRRRSLTAISLSSTNTTLAGATHRAIHVWSLGSPKVRNTIETEGPVGNLLFDPLGVFLLVLPRRGAEVQLRDAVSGTLLRKLNALAKPAGPMEFTPDGRLAAAMKDGTVVFWSIPSGRTTHTLVTGTSRPTAMAISPDGTILALGNSRGEISLWAVPEGNHLSCLFDKSLMLKSKKANTYTYTDQWGRSITTTQPCGAPLPPGAICTCNCVPGVRVVPRGPSGGGTICTCNKICTCVPIK